MMLLSPSPNQINAIGNRAIDGNGLNMEVRISNRSTPSRVALASAVRRPANAKPAMYPLSRSVRVKPTARGRRPEVIELTRAMSVSENVGKRREFASHLAYASHAAARIARSRTFRAAPLFHMLPSVIEFAVE